MNEQNDGKFLNASFEGLFNNIKEVLHGAVEESFRIGYNYGVVSGVLGTIIVQLTAALVAYIYWGIK